MPDPVNAYAELEIGMHAMQVEAIEGDVPYQVELRFTNPNSQAERAPKRGSCLINYETLLTCQSDPQTYGRTLTERVFADATILREYGEVKAAVEAEGLFLRVRLLVGPTAPRLHFLRWEMLSDPDTKAPLTTSEKVLFSRFMTSQDWRGIRLRPKAQLRALIAIAAPSNLAEYKLADVDLAGEIGRAREGLAGIEAKVQGNDCPLTLKILVDSLRDGVDILYLVCHGTITKDREPFLFLQDETGRVARVPGRDLALRIGELAQPPRLAVLASCESAGTENAPSAGDEYMAAQGALAPRLAEAGIPAILAMQGKITMDTVKQAMPVFFREMLRDGQIDRAMAVARGAVLGRRDFWMPALFLRLKSGRIWYEPGFGEGNDFAKWKSICRRVHDGKFIPILGPDIGEDLYGGMHELSNQLASEHTFPMAAAERSDLAKVTQYLSIDQDRGYAQDAVQEQLRRQLLERSRGLPGDNSRRTLPAMIDLAVQQIREKKDDPYRILADLPASLYITASPETMLFKAVKAAGKNPEALFCPWRPTETNHPKEPQSTHDPAPQTPLVYHVFGVFGVTDSLALTEDDFLDYLIATSTYKLMPKVVRGSLMESSLLFLGFQLDDWTFRVLFRLIMTLEGAAEMRQYSHVGVQVNPDEHSLADVERARKYLESYFCRNRCAGRSEPSIDIYWGSASDFLKELRRRLEDIAKEDPAPAPQEVANGWF
jgi:hypothetical protein